MMVDKGKRRGKNQWSKRGGGGWKRGRKGRMNGEERGSGVRRGWNREERRDSVEKVWREWSGMKK